MAQTLAQLTNPKTTAQMRQQLLDALQGRSVVTRAQPNTGAGSVVLSGTPSAVISVLVKIVAGGEPGAATWAYSLDGGLTWSSTATTPASGSVALGTYGVSVAFAAGPAGSGVSFVTADQFSFYTALPVFPVTSWQEGGTARTLIEGDAAELADLTTLVGSIARSGFVTLQPGVTGASGAWLDQAAVNVYGINRNAAVVTIGQVTLHDTGNAGPFTILPGSIWIGSTPSLASTTPLRYLNTTGGTLPLGGSLTITVAAEMPGAAYNASNTTMTSLLTSLPGVTVDAISAWITQQGADVESDLALSTRCLARWPSIGIGATSATFDLWARTASAEVTRTKIAPGSASTAISGSNASTTNILVASSAGFVAGSSIAFASADGSYRLVTNVPDATHVTVTPAFGAAPTTGTLAVASGGQIDVWVAGTSGAVSGGAVTAVATYIGNRVPLGTLGNVANSSNLTITIAGTVYVATAQLATAQAAGAAALQALIAATPIGGTLYLSQVIEAVNAPAGVRNSSGILINGAAADLVLTASQVAAALTNSLTWTGV